MTNFFGFTTQLTIFSCLDTEYLDSLVSLFPFVDVSNILTCFGSFQKFPLLLLTKKKDTKGADIGNL